MFNFVILAYLLSFKLAGFQNRCPSQSTTPAAFFKHLFVGFRNFLVGVKL